MPFPALPAALDRRRRAAASATRSRAVRLLRAGLPVAACAMIGAVVAWPQQGSHGKNPLFLNPAASDSLVEGPHMLNPRLVSVGGDEKPLRIRAASAQQPQGPNGPILLTAPEAELVLRNGDTAIIAAGSAIFRPDQPEDILLQGGIRFRDASGNTMSGDTLTIDTGRQTAFSTAPVEARFGSGTVKADGISITEGGNAISFQGRTTSRMTVGKTDAPTEAR